MSMSSREIVRGLAKQLYDELRVEYEDLHGVERVLTEAGLGDLIEAGQQAINTIETMPIPSGWTRLHTCKRTWDAALVKLEKGVKG